MNKRILYTCILLLTVISASFKVSGQTTYIWNGTGVKFDVTVKWNVSTNWVPVRSTPQPNDILVFNSGGDKIITDIPIETVGQILVTNNTKIYTYGIHPVAAQGIFTISGLTGDDLVIAAGSQLSFSEDPGLFTKLHFMMSEGASASIYGGLIVSTSASLDAVDAGAIVFHSGATFVNGAGSAFGNSGTPEAVVFESGSNLSIGDGDPFGLAAPASKIVLMPGSNFTYGRDASVSPSGRTYGNVGFSNYNSYAASRIISGPYPFICDNLGTITPIQINVTGGINIKGNININGGSFNINPPSPSITTFNGTSLQTISSAFSNALIFGSQADVVINNPAGVTIVYGSNFAAISDITMYKSLTFQQGVFKFPPQSKLTLAAGATVTGASSNSFVDGNVKKTGNTAFTFPVGKDSAGFKGYAPISISAPTDIADAFTASYTRKPATDLSTSYAPGLFQVSPVDYWSLDRTTGNSTVDVTLGWTAESVVGNLPSSAANLPNLTNAHYNGSSMWDSYSGILNPGSNTTTGSVTRYNVSTFSPFALGTAPSGGPLPIDLTYLNGARDNGKHNLEWQINCYNTIGATMQLERSSNGRNYSAIYNIAATATRCQLPFYYTDAQPLDGNNYYRLKITDANGPITYSDVIVLINKNTGFDMVVQPTLVSNSTVLKISAAKKSMIQVVLTDANGRQVQKMQYQLIAGSNRFTVNLAGLAAGNYQVTSYTDEGKLQTIRIIKQ
jgi:hypothetical protein